MIKLHEGADRDIEVEIADILRREIRLVAILSAETCGICGEELDVVWRVKNGNIEHCAKLIGTLITARFGEPT